MDIILQVWGGGFYLLNKIFFALAEGKSENTKRQLKIAGWTIYILGVPAWVIILISKHDWIAASIETGGVPSMLFGLFTQQLVSLCFVIYAFAIVLKTSRQKSKQPHI